jgi:hypothetical protein
MRITRRRVPPLVVVATLTLTLAVAAACSGGDDDRDARSAGTTTTGGTGVTRTQLGQASPVNAPGQMLHLEHVTIAPGAKLAEHFHLGTQVARVMSGTLTYNIVSGTATITRAGGQTEEASGPKEVRLEPGDTIVETSDLVHFGANDTGAPVEIELAALLAQGAPLATTVGTGGTGTPIHLSANLDSQARTLLTAGPAGSLTYGWNHLVGTATLDGQPVTVDMLGSVNYTRGSGPFSGFITFTFVDGSKLAATMQGAAQASPDNADTAVAATLGVFGGTGRYEAVTGTGTFSGSRTAALGTTVASTFDLRLQGAK